MMTNSIPITVVIPAYDEPEALTTIRSLFVCERGDFEVAIILLVNSYSISPESAKASNRLVYRQAISFAEANNRPNFSLFPLWVENLPGRQTGAGLPRRIGMEEALRRFREKSVNNGIIASLDADTTVSANYLTEIQSCFKQYRLQSATIAFHHPVEHLPVDDPVRRSTEVYEKYLHYYREALEYTGFPYAYFTVGSAFAVTAEVYTKAGGMGKQQAGEDFYFLHKVFPLGNTRFIDSACVYPAARVSNRVPFGTGPAVAKMIADNDFVKETYSMEAFEDLKNLFDLLDFFYRASAEETEKIMSGFPPHLSAFLHSHNFLSKISETKKHTSNYENFKKRFFSYFTAFRILKYLNAVHPKPYAWKRIERY